MVEIIDTHSHLYGEEFLEDIEAVIQRCKDVGVSQILLPNIDLESVDKMHVLCEAYPDICLPMMGLHPCSVDANYKETLNVLYDNFQRRDYCGIGEIGMDLFWDVTTQDWQEDAFLTQIEWAIEKNLGVSIHSRNATQRVIELLKPYKGKLTGVFHCFTESLELAQEIIKLDFYLGIGGVSTFKKAGVVSVIQELGLERLVLETDSPYLAPTPFRGKRNESSYTAIIGKFIADSLVVSLDKVAEVTTLNARHIYKINEPKAKVTV